jgi:hypothetical protein
MSRKAGIHSDASGVDVTSLLEGPSSALALSHHWLKGQHTKGREQIPCSARKSSEATEMVP